MSIEDYDIVGSYNNQRITGIDAERTINLFEYIDPHGKKPKSLLFTSGLQNSNYVFTGAEGGWRAQFVFTDGNTYGVIGNKVVRVTPNGVVTVFSPNLNTISGYVGIDANTFQIIFVDGSDGWIYDTEAQTFNQITDPNFPTNPLDVTFLDGFFVVPVGNTNTFRLSEFDQGMVWGNTTINFDPTAVNTTTDKITLSSNSGLDTGVAITFSSTGTLPAPLVAGDTYYSIAVSGSLTDIQVATTYKNAILGSFIDLTTQGTGTHTITNNGELQQGEIISHPGNIIACRTLHRRLFLFSQFFTEVWENRGLGANLPFRRNNSLLLEYGCATIGSVATGFDRMIFLSQDRDGLGSVMEVLGTETVPISTRALDYQLAQYAALNQIADCRSFLVKENGLIFYRMNFTAANHTYVFNVSMSDRENLRWHEEQTLNESRHPGQTHSYMGGKNYYGSYNSPTLYIVSDQFYTNNGEAIPRIRIGRPIVAAGYQRRRIDRFQLDVMQGDIAAFNNQISSLLPAQPEIYLSVSKNGGITYGYRQKALMGSVGQYSYRTVWRKLGVIPRGQAFVPKIEFYSNYPLVILGAAWFSEILPE